MSKHYLIQTERLGLRTWKESDLAPFAQINASSEVMRYYPNTLSKEATQKFMDRIIQQYQDYGFSVYAVDLLATNQFIGYIGFMRPTFKSNFTPCVEIGWRLDHRVWNQGLATEGALACLEYGFKTLQLDKIYSFTATINSPSERIMQKIGMRKIDEFDHPLLAPDSPLRRHVLYLITNQSLDQPKTKR
ncbi:GNAT family N-acetyltransferase [Aureispira anguillae]|uniref:GNAT family N-acetyltransferase n=1 Tax=Aureispira anguillae TaxID=2864201 RepID=A0A915YFC0_9BACT|nr:GNAT family N-acetyltransferase [Aureispira anguillae]BDS11989.1 GNAT family N-acetyltransferase [Aureispira anguillae]